MTPKYISKENAAKYLDISVRTIERLIARREIPSYPLGDAKNSPVRICVSDLDKWVAKFRKEAIGA